MVGALCIFCIKVILSKLVKNSLYINIFQWLLDGERGELRSVVFSFCIFVQNTMDMDFIVNDEHIFLQLI